MAGWKARVRLPTRHWTFLASSYRWGTTRPNVSNLAAFRRAWVTLSQDFRRKGSSLENIFLVCTKLDTFWYLTIQTAPCYTCSSRFDNTGVWQTDRRTDGPTDGIAVASTTLAMRALRCAVKTVEHRRSDSRSLLVAITSRLVDVLAVILNTAF